MVAFNLFVLGFVIDILGELMLALSVIRVHKRLLEEKSVDKAVQKDIRLEMKLGILAIVLIVLGSGLQFVHM